MAETAGKKETPRSGGWTRIAPGGDSATSTTGLALNPENHPARNEVHAAGTAAIFKKDPLWRTERRGGKKGGKNGKRTLSVAARKRQNWDE